MPSDWLAIVRQTYRKYLAGAGQSMSAFRTSLLPLTSRPSPLTFRPRLSPSQFAPRSFPLADRPSQFAPRSFSLAPQCPSRNSRGIPLMCIEASETSMLAPCQVSRPQTGSRCIRCVHLILGLTLCASCLHMGWNNHIRDKYNHKHRKNVRRRVGLGLCSLKTFDLSKDIGCHQRQIRGTLLSIFGVMYDHKFSVLANYLSYAHLSALTGTSDGLT